MPGGQVRYTTTITDPASSLNGRSVSVSYTEGVPDFSQLGVARVDIPNPVGRGASRREAVILDVPQVLGALGPALRPVEAAQAGPQPRVRPVVRAARGLRMSSPAGWFRWEVGRAGAGCPLWDRGVGCWKSRG